MVKMLEVIYEEYLHYIGLSRQNAVLSSRHSFRRAEIQEQNTYIIFLIIITSVKRRLIIVGFDSNILVIFHIQVLDTLEFFIVKC